MRLMRVIAQSSIIAAKNRESQNREGEPTLLLLNAHVHVEGEETMTSMTTSMMSQPMVGAAPAAVDAQQAEADHILLTELIEEYNLSAGMERLKARLGEFKVNCDDETLKSLLKKNGYDADATAQEVLANILDKR